MDVEFNKRAEKGIDVVVKAEIDEILAKLAKTGSVYTQGCDPSILETVAKGLREKEPRIHVHVTPWYIPSDSVFLKRALIAVVPATKEHLKRKRDELTSE